MADKSRVLRVFNWKIGKRQTVAELEKFQKNAIFGGQNPADLLAKVITEYNVANDSGRNLVTESQLVAELTKKKLGLTRQWLKSMRDEEVLVRQLEDGSSERVWYTDGHSIVYDLDATLKIIRERKKAGNSKTTKEVTS